MNIPLPLPNKIAVPPVVLLVSGDEYAVAWATTRRSTGTLSVSTGNKTQLFHSTSAGMLRHNDKLHVVRVAKSVLDNCDSYHVQNHAMLYNTGYVALRGRRVTSPRYHFTSYRDQSTIHALFCTDVHGEQKRAIQNARALQQKTGAAPNLILLGGDIPNDGLHSRRSFTKGVLRLAAKLGGSEIPVLYARGNHETRGQWATELPHYIGDLYFTANYGPISFLVLDNGEDKPDNHPEYSGLADFAAYRTRQLAWLNALVTTGHRVALCHAHNLDDTWYPPLNRLGITHLFVGHGHNNSAWVHQGIHHYEDGGPATTSWLTFQNDKVTAKSMCNETLTSYQL